MKHIKILLGALLLMGTASLNAEVGTLSRIIDGDTVKFGKDTCRFAFIDTPESKDNSRLQKFQLACNGVTKDSLLNAGKKSAEKISDLLQVGKQYKYDVSSTDKYGRKICNIYANGESVNLEMVKEGYALPFYHYLDNSTFKEYSKAVKNARENNKGLFSTHKRIMECMDNELLRTK